MEKDHTLAGQPQCDWCRQPSVTRWREGRGTGHSETVYACEDHMHLKNED